MKMKVKMAYMYFYRKKGYSGDLTVMVDADGKPLIWEGN